MENVLQTRILSASIYYTHAYFKSLTLFQELSVLDFASINILPNIHFIHHIPKSQSSNSIKLQPRYIKSRTSTSHYVF